jgi:16S rRNA (cytosine1402-N4)-methyltransferase
MAYFHQSVLLKEVIENLCPQSGDNFIDCTVGGGGHTLALLEKTAPTGRVLGLDLDEKALEAAKEKAAEARVFERLILVEDNFANLKNIVENYKFQPVSGIILDLGLSSAQLADEERGFSFKSSGRLDMRFGKTQLAAYEIINSWSKDELAEIFAKYGEEPLAQKIAAAIVERRKKAFLFSARDLADLILKIKPYFGRKKIHPATKIFQALRIAVNQELDNLEKVLPQAVEILISGGRLAVISFHSLEDRVVKNFFRFKARSEKPIVRLINKKVIRPSYLEIKSNPRARSAKLRVVEKI